MNDMLHAAVEIGTGKRAQLNGWPMAGKTGTSQKARDALFVGYTSRMVTGVWLGNDDDKGTTLSGGNVPVEIWSQFMTKAHEGMAVADLPGAGTDLTVAADQQRCSRWNSRRLSARKRRWSTSSATSSAAAGRKSTLRRP